MNIIWTLLGKPLALMGGRSLDELRRHDAADCNGSILVGVLCLLSVGIIGAGHYLFWSQLPHTAPWALPIAVALALVFAVVYRIALRALELLGFAGRLPVLAMLLTLMGVNALLAGHELPLLAFRPQVEAQARLDAARGVTAYATAVENSLGLPQLRARSSELDKALSAATGERAQVPDVVQQFQQQARACEAEARRLQAALPASVEEPGFAAAQSVWREKRARCGALARQAATELAQHQARLDEQIAALNQQRLRNVRSLDEATAEHEHKLKRDAPTLTDSATTGFARHGALWAAVAAGSVPAWAAYGLMAAVLVLDGFSFVVKLLMRPDRAAAARLQAAAADQVHDRLHAQLHALHAKVLRRAVRAQAERAEQDLAELARQVVGPALVQELELRSFVRAAERTQQAHRQQGRARPSLLARLAGIAAAIRGRRARPTIGEEPQPAGA